jgi:hypothetical protein
VKLLHGFFRSGSSHRLRIALDLKGPACETLTVDLDESTGGRMTIAVSPLLKSVCTALAVVTGPSLAGSSTLLSTP